jgi:hypothetical protein
MRNATVALTLGAAIFVGIGCRDGGSGRKGRPASGSAELENCASPSVGSRYSVCGSVATSQFDTQTVNGRSLAGWLDKTPEITGARFTLKGGSFNVYR